MGNPKILKVPEFMIRVNIQVILVLMTILVGVTLLNGGKTCKAENA